jgi:hypothetical protein
MKKVPFSEIREGQSFFWDNRDGLGVMEFIRIPERKTSNYRAGPLGPGIYSDPNNVKRARDGAYTWFDPHDQVSVK